MNTILLCAALITAQPLANADVLEPSIQNEVDHALNAAATNEVALSDAAVAFAALWATNGMNATEKAIALVSSQKGGRWTFQGADVTPVAVRQLRRLSGLPEPPLKLAIFSDHIEEIVHQERIDFASALTKMRALGIDGLAVSQGCAEDRLAAARAAGFAVLGSEKRGEEASATAAEWSVLGPIGGTNRLESTARAIKILRGL